MRCKTRFVFLLVFLSLWILGQNTAASASAVSSGQNGSNIISIKDGEIALSNPLGCKLIIHRDGDKYGLGTFYFHNVQMGGTVTAFLNEDNYYVWDEYKATRYEIIENTPEGGTIKFYGTVGFGEENVQSRWAASITLTNRNTAYQLHYQVEPYILASRLHPLYVAVPFFNDDMQFVQYPIENPLRPPFKGNWYVDPDVGKVPFMFGKQTLKGTDYFVGVGYRLEGQDFTQGKLQYDTTQPDTPLRIYFPYRVYPAGAKWFELQKQTQGFRRPPYELRMVLSTAESQAACIAGYREESGFDSSTPIVRRIADSLAAVMRGYRDAPLKTSYIPGKGYRGRAWANSDDLANYYMYIWPGSNVQIAFQLYQYWAHHRSETWAKERAIEMANFFVKSQIRSGAIPRNWDEEKQEYTTEQPNMPPHSFIYCPWNTAQGSESLYRLYVERKKTEGIDEVKWKESALHGMDWIVNRINADGLLGFGYDKDDKSSGMISSNAAAALRALDYIYQEARDDRYDQARAKLEAWYYKTFAEINEYYNDPDDNASWRPPALGAQFKNNDAVETFPFAAYCALRFMETKEPRYLRWAEDVAAYGWLTRMPLQMPGFTHGTKGVVVEQAIFPEYDCPWAGISSNRVFPYLALLTGDPFYARYYKMLIQTQLSFQQYDQKYPFFASVLAPAPDLREHLFGQTGIENSPRPYDRLFEEIDGKIGVWLEWATSYFVEEMTVPSMYSYFGGKDWGVGMDYEVPFQPNFGDNPYVTAASTDLTSAGWNSQEHSLYTFLNGDVGSSGTLRVKWDAVKYPLARVAVEVNGKTANKSSWHYDSGDQSLIVEYVHHEPTLHIKVRSQ